jgi:putative SOS response-associated peptidase YedK
MLAVARVDGINILDKYRWGQVPFWAKDRTISCKMINVWIVCASNSTNVEFGPK